MLQDLEFSHIGLGMYGIWNLDFSLQAHSTHLLGSKPFVLDWFFPVIQSACNDLFPP